MKVLRLANFVSPTSGGIRTVVRRISHHQAAIGVHSTFVAPGPDAGIDCVPGSLDVGTLPGAPIAPGQPYRLMLNRGAIRALLDDVRPDVVEVHDQLTLAWLGRECRARGIRSVLVAHERLDLLAGFWSRIPAASGATKRWLDRVGRSFDVVVAPSRFAAAPYAEAGIDVRVVHWGVDHEVFAPGEYQPINEPQALRLLHVGRLSPEKDPTLSATATEYLAAQGIQAELTVVGSGPAAARFSVSPHARLVGYVDGPRRVAELMRRSDVFLAPGPFETFGLGALEAMACGLPVVCRASGSVSEIPGTAAVEGCAEAFGDAALALAQDPLARARSAESARNYNWANSANELLAAYQP